MSSGLAEPQFIQTEDFRSIIYQPSTLQVTPQVAPEVGKLILIADTIKSRDELQEILCLKDRENFRKLYINEALNLKLIEMTYPTNPTAKTKNTASQQKEKPYKHN